MGALRYALTSWQNSKHSMISCRTSNFLHHCEPCFLRTCSRSSEYQAQECEMDELQAGIEQSLAVLPQPPVLLQPGKAALDDPALGDHCKLVQFAALGNLHCDLLAQRLAHTLSKRLTRIPAITQHALHSSQAWLAAPERLQCALAIGYLGRGDRHCMGKALRVD